MFLLHNLRTVRSQNNRCSDVYKTFERLECIWCDSVDLRIQLKETFQIVWHFFLFILSLSLVDRETMPSYLVAIRRRRQL